MSEQAVIAEPQAEASVLAALMLQPERIAEVRANLTERHFTRVGHRCVWRALLGLDDRRASIDFVTLVSYLDNRGELESCGGTSGLLETAATATSASHVQYHCSMLIDAARKRDLIEFARRLGANVPGARTGTGEVTSVIEHAEQELLAIGARALNIKPIESVRDLLHGAVSEILNPNVNLGLPTGLDNLDDVIHGLRPGDVMVIAARPGGGKTMVGLQIALNAAKSGESTLFISAEVTTQQLIERALCNVGEIDSTDMRDRRFSADDRRSALLDASAYLERIGEYLVFDDTAQPTLPQVRALARRMQARGGIRLLVVDYLQLLRCPECDNRYEEVTRVSGALKALAKELGIPVIALAQVKRPTTPGAKPALSDLRESGSIEQDADFVVLLHEESPSGGPQCDLTADVAKNRHGPTRETRIYVDKRYFKAGLDAARAVPIYGGGA